MKNNKVVALSLFIGSILFFFLHACSTSSQPKEGFIDVEGGKIWYKIVGEGDKTPVLLLHGGPGSSSFYLEPLKELSDERPVIFIDQLGCGRSTRITDTTLMTIEKNVEQLEQVRKKNLLLLGFRQVKQVKENTLLLLVLMLDLAIKGLTLLLLVT
jgi:proline iminopeptidase